MSNQFDINSEDVRSGTRVLIVLTSHTVLGDTGKPTGWYVPEAAHPWHVFNEAGIAIDWASPAGGRGVAYGLDSTDSTQAAFVAEFGENGPDTLAVSDVDASRYAAIFYVGGHGTMWDFPENLALAKIASSIYENNGVVAAVCHGPAGLINVKLSSGVRLVAGRRVAAFTNDEEIAAGLETVVPFLLADALVAAGAVHMRADNFAANTVIDGRLITGQNPASAIGVAEAVRDSLTSGKEGTTR
jgi:putative intracellular protease/amidase